MLCQKRLKPKNTFCENPTQAYFDGNSLGEFPVFLTQPKSFSQISKPGVFPAGRDD
jgi:hypothetical protein